MRGQRDKRAAEEANATGKAFRFIPIGVRVHHST
jgi:hypothetical protein